eukprot:1527569-Rhodomonas_salina.2
MGQGARARRQQPFLFRRVQISRSLLPVSGHRHGVPLQRKVTLGPGMLEPRQLPALAPKQR